MDSDFKMPTYAELEAAERRAHAMRAEVLASGVRKLFRAPHWLTFGFGRKAHG